jgi:hypothetical protein
MSKDGSGGAGGYSGHSRESGAASIPETMRTRFFKAQATEVISKDDWLIVDLALATAMRARTTYHEEKPPAFEHVPDLHDKSRDLLCMSYGLLLASAHNIEQLNSVLQKIESHLWPTIHNPSAK